VDAAADLLGRPPAEAARLLALRLLDAAAAAHARLADPGDAEALHDFRVAVRRLRSTLRAYRPALAESLSKRLERGLKKLGRTTGGGRDAEVQLAWLRAAEPDLAPAHRDGARWLAARLEAKRQAGYAAAGEHLEDAFADLAGDLRRRLGVYRAEVRLDGAAVTPAFAATAGAALEAAADELGERLAAIGAAGDVEAAHAARIAGKRLRYLLEPLAEEAEEAGALVKRLKGLQELLGELHDAHVLEDDLGAALGEAAAERARGLLEATLDGDAETLRKRSRGRTPQTGLLALAARNRARRDELFRGLDEGWLGGRAGRFLGDVEALARRLAKARASSRPARPVPAPAA
jgi:CHAD domain-containing protein